MPRRSRQARSRSRQRYRRRSALGRRGSERAWERPSQGPICTRWRRRWRTAGRRCQRCRRSERPDGDGAFVPLRDPPSEFARRQPVPVSPPVPSQPGSLSQCCVGGRSGVCRRAGAACSGAPRRRSGGLEPTTASPQIGPQIGPEIAREDSAVRRSRTRAPAWEASRFRRASRADRTRAPCRAGSPPRTPSSRPPEIE